ncbi:hypothetical protein OIO90_003443 [Microbotryomycetes sp. JL221]|nr:hypothetical protein OIO90_003443 [Microbotryomycetes sp. JL221]
MASTLNGSHTQFASPTDVIHPLEFARDAQALSTWINSHANTLDNILNRSTTSQSVKQRCSVHDLHQDLATLHKDSVTMREFSRWQHYRTFKRLPKREQGQLLVDNKLKRHKTTTTTTDNDDQDSDRDRDDGNDDDDDDDDDDEPMPALVDDTDLKPQDVLVGDKAIKLAHERDANKLHIMSDLDNEPFLLVTQPSTHEPVSDPQLLPRPITSVEQQTLSNILYTITFHPIVHASRLLGHTGQLKTITLVCLGSTSLWQIRQTVKQMCPDSTPQVELTQQSKERFHVGKQSRMTHEERNSNSQHGDNVDDESNDSESSQTTSLTHQEPTVLDQQTTSNNKKQTRVSANEQRRRKRLYARDVVNWCDRPLDTGSVFAIESKLYADGRPQVQDYADLILDSIDRVDWVSTKDHESSLSIQQTRTRRQSASSSPVTPFLNNNHIDTTTTNNLDSIDDDDDAEIGQERETIKPMYEKGSNMQQTRLGELSIKVGQPYWFLHQGDCEHVWTVDEIRYIHPADPKLDETTTNNNSDKVCQDSTSPYPIITFQSRSNIETHLINETICNICNQSKASLITIEDELTNQSPCFLCQICFNLLHGHEQDQGIQPNYKVLPLIES